MKVDLKKELKHLYNPSAREVFAIDIPQMNFLTVPGEGDPNGSESYKNAVEALYAVSYALKFMVKKSETAVDYSIMPLEGLWWADDMMQFDFENRNAWKWKAMIMQPEYVMSALFEEARSRVEKKKGLSALPSMRFESFHEGRTAQIMHVGPYAEEGPTIDRVHRFIEEQDRERSGKHHEIYLSDPNRTAPEKLKTVIRQPFE